MSDQPAGRSRTPSPPHPVPQIRELLHGYSDEHPVRAVHNVLNLHRPELIEGQWKCHVCNGADENPAPYPCPTVEELINAFDLDII